MYCETCRDYTLLNERVVCLFCDTKITDKNILKANKEESK